jgi:hypothetical protein
MADETKPSKTLEMRVAEIEDKLAKLHVTEDEMKAYHKVAALVGAAPCASACAAGACASPCLAACAAAAAPPCQGACAAYRACWPGSAAASACAMGCTIGQGCEAPGPWTWGRGPGFGSFGV